MEYSLSESRSVKLPEREAQVLDCAAQGLTDKEIAIRLGISQETVGTYWRRILLRFGAASRTEVVAKASELRARERIRAAEALNEDLLSEIHERSEAQARELSERNLLEAITQATLSFIAGDAHSRGVFDRLLQVSIAVTESEYGFIGEVLYDESGQPYLKEHALTNIAWSEETRKLYESRLASGLEFRNLNTLFGHVMTSGGMVIANDPRSDPRSGGMPEGHPGMDSFLGLPVFAGAVMIGMIGLANRPGGYDEGDVQFLQPLVATCAAMIQAYRSEMARQTAERELADSRRRLEVLMDDLRSAVLFEDQNRKVLFTNAAMTTMFSIPVEPKALIGADCAAAAKQSASLFSDPERFLARVDELLAAGEPVQSEKLELADGRVLARDFTPVWVGKDFRGYLWYYRDVTQEAKETHTVQSILSAALDAVIVIDENGSVTFWNEQAEDMFGYSSEDVGGRQLADLIIPAKLRASHREGLRKFIETGEGPLLGRRVEVPALHREGHEFQVELSITVIRSTSGPSFSAFIRSV